MTPHTLRHLQDLRRPLLHPPINVTNKTVTAAA